VVTLITDPPANQPNVVEIETTPDERRILDAAHLASVT
jgi:hypothetical protein